MKKKTFRNWNLIKTVTVQIILCHNFSTTTMVINYTEIDIKLIQSNIYTKLYITYSIPY